jgi:hypothetical protein
MKVFYGAAIQGAKNRIERIFVHKTLIETIKQNGHEVLSEHTTGKTRKEAQSLLNKSIGPLPPEGIERRIFIRNKMIEAIEGKIDAIVFEVSVPSLGTGIEIAHAYLRPRMQLKKIPILALYQKGFWPNNLSTMILGINPKEITNFQLKEYDNLEEAKTIVLRFLGKS